MNESHQLFKYRTINKNLLDSLLKGYIYFAKPDSLNDPFDCRVDINGSLSRAIQKCDNDDTKAILKQLQTNTKFLNTIQKSVQDVGVCSFSTELLNPLLWSHYSSEHRGVCLLYEIPELFLRVETNQIIGCSDIEYGDDTLTEWFINSYNDILQRYSDPLLKIALELLKKMFTIKGEDWKYEKEVRLLREHNGSLKIQKQFLKQICFGLNTPERDKDLLREIIRIDGYEVDFCEIKKTDTDFGLTAEGCLFSEY